MSGTWREIRRCGAAREAEALRAALAAHGVQAIVPDVHVMGVHPMCSRGAGDVRLLVLQDHVERALAILERLSRDGGHRSDNGASMTGRDRRT